jgi:hypothetical protein
MKAQNLYNGTSIVGCRFAFTLPVEIPVRAEPFAAAADAEPTTPPNSTVTS